MTNIRRGMVIGHLCIFMQIIRPRPPCLLASAGGLWYSVENAEKRMPRDSVIAEKGGGVENPGAKLRAPTSPGAVSRRVDWV